VSSDWYEMFIGILILINTGLTAIELQYTGYDIGHLLEYNTYDKPAQDVWPGADKALVTLNHLFLGIFTIDILFRVFVLRGDFWKMKLNWLDFGVVLMGWVELAVSIDINPFVLRMLRLFKFFRALRVLRYPHLMESMTMLVKCMVSSYTTMFWSMLLILVVNCIGGMIISILVLGYMQNESASLEARRDVFMYYGTFSRTLVTMFEVLFANWSPACRVLTENVTEWFGLFFILYRCLVGFAVLNVVRAVFIQQTMKMAHQDEVVMMDVKENARKSYGKKLKALFQELDDSNDGTINWDEFQSLLVDPQLRTFMSALDIEPHDLQELWEMLDDGDGQITQQEFISGATRMKGPAKGIDMVGLLQKTKKLEQTVEALFRDIQAQGIEGTDACVVRPCEVVGHESAFPPSKPKLLDMPPASSTEYSRL